MSQKIIPSVWPWETPAYSSYPIQADGTTYPITADGSWHRGVITFTTPSWTNVRIWDNAADIIEPNSTAVQNT
jgi:hypothetical protein